MPKSQIDPTKIRTRLTDLDVDEVSFVHRGAIGEVFTIMKSEDENPEDVMKGKCGNGEKETLSKEDSSNIANTISNLPDTEFISVMEQMMSRYNEINKSEGGTDMNEDQVKELVSSIVTEVIGKSLETVNSNFAKVNKSIDELAKKVEEPKATEEPKVDDVQKAANEEVMKAVASIGSAVTSLAETVSEITKGLESISTIGDTVKKMAEETLPGISSRVENIEKQEVQPNGVANDDETAIQKSASSSKWPSFTRAEA